MKKALSFQGLLEMGANLLILEMKRMLTILSLQELISTKNKTFKLIILKTVRRSWSRTYLTINRTAKADSKIPNQQKTKSRYIKEPNLRELYSAIIKIFQLRTSSSSSSLISFLSPKCPKMILNLKFLITHKL
jgi:hypothetical protein